MSAQRELRHGMVVADEADGGGVADLVHDIDATARLFDAEAATGKDFLVALGMQLGEALAELKLLTVDHDGAVGALLPFHGIGRQGVAVDAEEVTHAGAFQLQIAGHAVVRGDVDDVLLHVAENPAQHVIEMYADVSGDAAALVDVALPRGIVPVAARGDVSQVDVVDLILGSFFHLFLQCLDLVVETQLKDGVGLMALTFLHLLEGVDVPRVEHKGLLADDVSTEAQAVARVGVMQVVGRADAHVVDGGAAVAQLGVVTVEELLFGEEGSLGEVAVHDADAVVPVVGGDEGVTRVFDGFEVARGDVAADADECEILHELYFFSETNLKQIFNKSLSLFSNSLSAGPNRARRGRFFEAWFCENSEQILLRKIYGRFASNLNYKLD